MRGSVTVRTRRDSLVLCIDCVDISSVQWRVNSPTVPSLEDSAAAILVLESSKGYTSSTE